MVTLVLAAIVLGWCALAPRGSLARMWGRGAPAGPPFALWVVRDATSAGVTLRTIPIEMVSWDEPSRLLQDRPGDVLELRVLTRPARDGLAATAWRRWTYSESWGASFTSAERARARVLLAEALGAQGHPAAAAWVRRRGDPAALDVSWGGVALNAVFVLLVLALVASTGWVARTSAYRVERSLARGRCPACGYGLGGVPVEGLGMVRCPECGRGWTGIRSSVAGSG